MTLAASRRKANSMHSTVGPDAHLRDNVPLDRRRGIREAPGMRPRRSAAGIGDNLEEVVSLLGGFGAIALPLAVMVPGAVAMLALIVVPFVILATAVALAGLVLMAPIAMVRLVARLVGTGRPRGIPADVIRGDFPASRAAARLQSRSAGRFA